LSLAQHNARLNGLRDFEIVPSEAVPTMPSASFDVALTNPPYYANLSIARSFIQCCRLLLRPGGRFYLVTRQVENMYPLVAEAFSEPVVFDRRGYGVFFAAAS
jgi:16S rRNA (guanine1207-N2)-methyltransferase